MEKNVKRMLKRIYIYIFIIESEDPDVGMGEKVGAATQCPKVAVFLIV